MRTFFAVYKSGNTYSGKTVEAYNASHVYEMFDKAGLLVVQLTEVNF